MSDEPFVIEERHGALTVISLKQPDRYRTLSYRLRLELAGAVDRPKADEIACHLPPHPAEGFSACGHLKEMPYWPSSRVPFGLEGRYRRPAVLSS